MNQLTIPKALQAIKASDPAGAFEAAKWLVQRRIGPGPLVQILEDKKNGLQNRLAAAYAIGLIGKVRGVIPALMSILQDRKEHPKVRAEVAEALGHLRAKRAIPLLGEILTSNESSKIRAECIFALSEMWEFRAGSSRINSEAWAVLEDYARTGPTGMIGEQVRDALDAIQRGRF